MRSREKPLRAEVLAHWRAVLDLCTVEGGFVSVSRAHFHDSMEEWWAVLTPEERRTNAEFAEILRR